VINTKSAVSISLTSEGEGWNSCGSMPGLMIEITFSLSPPTLRAMSVVMVESEATFSSARAAARRATETMTMPKILFRTITQN
jgi:hypothetical protein